MWKQWSHVLWLSNGDSNTKFFHTKATQRHRKNTIGGIRDEHNSWKQNPEDIESIIRNYYQNLFFTSTPENQAATWDQIPQVITEEMNQSLTREFMEHEVVAALKQMAPLKAPSPDGMPPLFYQHFWQMVNQNIINSILSWLNSSTLPHLVNHTFIALIPKIKNPEYITEYRPISLCNVLYKIFSKVLANRLKKLLPTIITEHQFAFTKDRLITNNILVAFETLYSMKKYKFGDNGFMAFKLDMTKAYNWVEWSFLENLMRKMGFCENWIGLIMVCIRTVSYSVLINGEPKGMVYPS